MRREALKAQTIERNLYEQVVRIREEIDRMLTAALDSPPTVELVLFAGKLGSVQDILISLEQGGVPMADPDEKPIRIRSNSWAP
jgi:hypothetical protein